MSFRNKYEIGKVYGCRKLIAIRPDENGRLMAFTICELCGKEAAYRPDYLLSNHMCQCTIKTQNGMSTSRIYSIYFNMLDRCNNPNCHAYARYGGKGVSVADEWRGENGFINFYNWAIKHGYEDGLTIDRVDSDGDYSPENCQWLTRGENTARANRGKQHRKADKGDYYAISPSGKWFQFSNASEFEKEHPELSARSIRRYARGERKCHNGWQFGYISDLPSTESQSTIESVGETRGSE